MIYTMKLKGGKMKILEIETTTSITSIKRLCLHNMQTRRKGYEYEVLTQSRYLSNTLNKIGIKSYYLEQFNDYSKIKNNSYEPEADMIIGKMFYEFKELKDREKYFNRAKNIYKCLLNSFEVINPSILIQCQGAEIIRLLSHQVSKNKNIPSFFFGFSPFGLSFYNNPYADNWVEKEIINKKESLEFSKKYLEKYFDGKINFIYSKAKEEKIDYSVIPNKYKRYINRIIISIQDKDFSEKILGLIKLRFISKAKTFLGKFRKWKYNKNKKLPEKYFFFPLHLPIESQVTLRGNRFVYQSMVISLISQMLPENVFLVIREHPKHVGHLKKWELKLIKMHKNIILFNTKTPAQEIIKNSLGVITYNNTTGFEGILMGKPVITIGKSFYREQGVTYDCDNLNDIYKYINNIYSKQNSFVLENKKIIKFIARVYESSYNNLEDFLNEKR